MIKKKVIVFLFLVLIFSIFLLPSKIKAFDCLLINSNSSPEQRKMCENELAQIEAQLADLLKKQEAQKKQTGTIKGDVDYLNSQIKALTTKVKARSLAIAQLKVSIKEKVSTIENLSQKIKKEHETLAQLIKNTNELDNQNLIHLILSDESIFDFFNDVESYSSIKKAVKKSVQQINETKELTQEQKEELEKKQDAETDAKAELENAQRKTSQAEAEKKKLLEISKQKESEYQKLAAERRLRADKIRNALFSLAGLSKGIPFGTALSYANDAQKMTAIDPAFLLAILTQESNLGSNVGRCYLTDIEGEKAGYGINPSTGKIWTNLMKPTRDIAPFLEITSKLNLNPYNTTVSCPIAGIAGYGGAMGPAQFIPSTWKIFISRLQKTLGHYPNPWEPKDAFVASSMYLTDLGAVGNSASAQHKAACRYYGSGGATCSYSNSVMKLKAKIQADIDLLSD